MKKTLSVCLAAILALTFALSAFAGGTVSRDSVLKEIDATAGYISNGISGYTADSAVNYYYIAMAGTKGASFYPAFLQSVKDCLDANGGKLVTAYGENISSYAAVIGIIDAMGDDPTNVNSVNLVELFENLDNKEVSHPYYYNIVIPVAAKYCDEAFVKSLCDSFIESNYTMGSGMNYWGFACDNTAMFISAVAQSGLDCYDAVLADAVNVLNTYKTEGGYCYNPEYGTAANVNSTGLALMAKCEYYTYKGTAEDNMAELIDLYNALLTFKGLTEGSYTYEGTESTYSAADAIKGLISFYAVLSDKMPDAPEDTDKPDVTPDKPDTKPETPDVTGPSADNKGEADKNPDIPNTDGGFSVISFGAMSLGVIIVSSLIGKKKENID